MRESQQNAIIFKLYVCISWAGRVSLAAPKHFAKKLPLKKTSQVRLEVDIRKKYELILKCTRTSCRISKEIFVGIRDL